ncbi:MAG: helix-turn-helix domain-containing protein [Gammaproteobacteria bacterium]|nr:helix-turn-helix domain-containing protein [Gammaproteobacteria bacterium]
MSRTITTNEHKKIVGERIRQARQMAGFNTIASLTECFPDWSERRLGNYENGTSLPNPLDILRISKETKTSPCWITFGIGSIRASDRDVQAIRYQNFSHLYEKMKKTEQLALRKAINLKPKEVNHHLDNPYLKITDTMCHKIERHLGKSKGWMEQQHVEMDGLCDFFPEDVKELLSIYSNLDSDGRAMLLEISRTVQSHSG